MRNKLTRILPLLLAAALQSMPLLRSLIPIETQGLAPSTWAIVLKLATGAVAMFGYHAISSASSIAISPATALQGVPYTGTITYSGGHAGSVSSWKGVSNWTNTGAGSCMVSYPIAPGLIATPNAKNTCTVTGTPSNTGTYAFTMHIYSGSACNSDSDTRATSIAIGSTNGVNFAPTWTLIPQAQVAQLGTDTALSAGALGKPTPSYTWFNGFNQVGTNSSVVLTNVQLGNAGLYTVQAANGVSPNASTNAYLTVVVTPSSLLFHYTNYLAVGSTTNLTCVVSNVPGTVNKFQWALQPANIPGATAPNLTLSNVGNPPYVSGTYTVNIASYTTNTTPTNFLVGTSASASAGGQGFDSYWVFGNKPTITASPASLTNAPGSSAAFNVVATGDSSLSDPTPDAFGRSMMGTNYQWYSSNVTVSVLADQTNASLTFNPVDPNNAGNYFVIVTNVYGAATSSIVSLTVNSASTQPPNISIQPQSQIIPQGVTVQLSVTAGGTPPPTFQWSRNNGNVSDGATGNGSTLSGSSSNILTIANAQAADSGSYSVGITNVAGGTNSSPAQLLVVAPATGSQSPRLTNSISGQFGLSFGTLAGYRYLLQRSTNLNSPANWVTLTNRPPTFSNAPFSFFDGFSNPESFYRTIVTNQ